MKYIILILAPLMLFVAASASAQTSPTECADEDREIPGNRSTPCMLSFPDELQDVRYDVIMEYPKCIEEISFAVPGATGAEEPLKSVLFARVHPQKPIRDWLWDIGQVKLGEVKSSTDRVHLLGYQWSVDSAIWGSAFLQEDTYLKEIPHVTHFRLIVDYPGTARPSVNATGLMPDVSGVYDLANACLEQVRSELALKEARKAAETQAQVAQAEIAAAEERKRMAALEELTKTETLQAELAHEEEVAAILRDTVRIRLAGQEDRARLTNEYLARLAATEAEFTVEASEVEERIQQYVDFNAELLAQIHEYQQAIEAQITATDELLATQRAAITELAELPEEPATPEP